MRKTRLILSALLCAALLTACKKKESLSGDSAVFSFVPEKAVVVVNINTGQLRKKIDWDYINGNPVLAFLKLSMKDNILIKYLNDAESTGIDFDKEIVAYMLEDSAGEKNLIYSVMELKDKEKFEEMIKVFTKTETLTNAKNYTTCSGKGMMAGWNNDIVIMVQSISEMSADGAYLSPDLEKAFSVHTDLSANNAAFKSLMEQHSDIDIWADSKSMMRYFGSMENNAANFKADLVYALNFNKGDIAIDINTNPEDAAGKEIMKKVFNRTPQNDLLQYLPDHYSAVMHVSAEPDDMIKAMETLTGKNMLEEMRKDMDSTIAEEDISKMINQIEGDGLFAFGPFSEGMNDPAFVGIFNTTTENALQALTPFTKDFSVSEHNGITQYIKQYDTIFAIQKSKILFFSNNEPLLMQASDGQKSNQQLKTDIAEAMKKDPLVLFVDGANLFSSASSFPSPMETTVLNLFENAVIIAEPFQADMHHGNVTVHIKNKDDYSINVIIQTILDSAGNMFKSN